MTPASIRNKNPGAQEPGPSSRKFGSTSHEVLRWTYKGKPATNKIATFPTSQHGAAAMFHLLNRKYTGRSIEKAITKWCGGYYAGAYAKALEAHGGCKATDTLTSELLQKPEFAIALCKAMARVEAGRDFPMSDEQWRAAHEMAFGGAVAPEFSPDNDVPSPGPNARLKAAINDKKEAITLGVTLAGGAAKVAVDTSQPVPAPKLDHKAAIAKGKETREVIEQAKDLGIFARDMGKWAMGDGMFIAGGILAAGAAAWWWSRR